MKENKTNREWVLEYLADHPQATGQEIYTGISAKGCKAPLSSITALISQLAGKGGVRKLKGRGEDLYRYSLAEEGPKAKTRAPAKKAVITARDFLDAYAKMKEELAKEKRLRLETERKVDELKSELAATKKQLKESKEKGAVTLEEAGKVL